MFLISNIYNSHEHDGEVCKLYTSTYGYKKDFG